MIAKKISLVLAIAMGAPAFAAEYQVPVEEAELEPHATFALPRLQIKVQSDETLRLTYRLPSELVGREPQRFRATGPVPSVGLPSQVSGKGVFGTCEVLNPNGGEADLSCLMEYDSLTVDLEAARNFLIESGMDPIKRQSVERVVEIFSFKPIGIIKTRIQLQR